MDNRPIGIFDSGLGGLTAVRRLQEILPGEPIVYFGDTGRVPYGTRSPETILKYTRQDVQFLMQFEPKAIIAACNTASAVALSAVSQEIEVPMFGVVEPTCKKALASTKNGRIGLIGTAATVRSGAYESYLREGSLPLFSRACPLFVPLVENGRFLPGDPVTKLVIAEYLTPLRQACIDTLILGCTHYPLLEGLIGEFMGPSVTLIDSGAEAVDFACAQIEPAEKSGGARFFVSDDPAAFHTYAAMFLQNDPPEGAQLVDLSCFVRN